jgi:hypothetical protein
MRRLLYRFEFAAEQPVSVMEIEASRPALAGDRRVFDSDRRKLGLGLYKLVMVPGHCLGDKTTIINRK